MANVLGNRLVMSGAVLAPAGLAGFAIPVLTTRETRDVVRIGGLRPRAVENAYYIVPLTGLVLIGAGLHRNKPGICNRPRRRMTTTAGSGSARDRRHASWTMTRRPRSGGCVARGERHVLSWPGCIQPSGTGRCPKCRNHDKNRTMNTGIPAMIGKTASGGNRRPWGPRSRRTHTGTFAHA